MAGGARAGLPARAAGLRVCGFSGNRFEFGWGGGIRLVRCAPTSIAKTFAMEARVPGIATGNPVRIPLQPR